MNYWIIGWSRPWWDWIIYFDGIFLQTTCNDSVSLATKNIVLCLLQPFSSVFFSYFLFFFLLLMVFFFYRNNSCYSWISVKIIILFFCLTKIKKKIGKKRERWWVSEIRNFNYKMEKIILLVLKCGWFNIFLIIKFN